VENSSKKEGESTPSTIEDLLFLAFEGRLLLDSGGDDPVLYPLKVTEKTHRKRKVGRVGGHFLIGFCRTTNGKEGANSCRRQAVWQENQPVAIKASGEGRRQKHLRRDRKTIQVGIDRHHLEKKEAVQKSEWGFTFRLRLPEKRGRLRGERKNEGEKKSRTMTTVHTRRRCTKKEDEFTKGFSFGRVLRILYSPERLG